MNALVTLIEMAEGLAAVVFALAVPIALIVVLMAAILLLIAVLYQMFGKPDPGGRDTNGGAGGDAGGCDG